MPTIYDIAKKTGFSISTVSKVLNNYKDVSENTRKVVFEAVNELGYFPNSSARTLTTKRSWSIGVVFDEEYGIGMEHPFFNAVMESFKRNVGKHGYDLLFSSNRNGKPKSYIDHFQYRGVDGVVVVRCAIKDPYVEKLMESNIPSVVIDQDTRLASVVYSDNYYGSELAVEHFYSLGHEKIAHIAGSQKMFTGLQRKKGFMKAMKQHKLIVRQEYIVEGGPFTYESGQQGMRKLLECEELPTAVFAASDIMALGAISEIRKSGLNVPKDISVIGFDDIKISKYTTPELTTIKQDTALIGKTAANLLMDQINDKKKNFMSVKIPVELIQRNSCQTIDN
ncbi:LacI family DNA-binding transcriptional regulator [Evansella cellulosilytica]|uniref:Transcriptional regulator, LacI family n=1 Tax=Evansella cellulosilytica (strain ATCC 21833 / DSM 2522 / FERM P-1141 / JCM 9156 / N-4) TaxID=649639 RepID=E6TZ89_EVAC2|nr:LacI family DNA-binding transcriptional regulator [Evansella cellulosilytica]ADU28951.1 transcriptional regulator, LacI family [Evansella cellulosilytica DSM 2522]